MNGIARIRQGWPGGCFVRQAVCLWMAAFLPVMASMAAAQEWVARRHDQFPTEPAYLVVPAPYSLPGHGEGILLLGFVSNLWRTPTDVYGYWITGDVAGYGAGVSEVHLLPKTVLLDVYRERIDRAQQFQYSSRGMDTQKSDYQIAEGAVLNRGGALTLALAERHFEVFYAIDGQEIDIEKFRDRDGKLVRDLKDPIDLDQQAHTIGVLVDNTDDRWDPRRGIRGTLVATQSPPQNAAAPDFYVVNATVDVYIPIGRSSTWVFDFFHSEAVVRRKGETNPAVLLRDVCPIPIPQCESSPEAQDYVANTVAANKNGSSVSLGGRDRLRSYPVGRFQGAYTQYAGTELRFSLTDEVTPFDYFFWKDVRTNLQVALIGEVGTVAESRDKLWERSRSSYGAGFRIVTAGGGVYRADYLSGDEGPLLTIIVNYPW